MNAVEIEEAISALAEQAPANRRIYLHLKHPRPSLQKPQKDSLASGRLLHRHAAALRRHSVADYSTAAHSCGLLSEINFCSATKALRRSALRPVIGGSGRGVIVTDGGAVLWRRRAARSVAEDNPL